MKDLALDVAAVVRGLAIAALVTALITSAARQEPRCRQRRARASLGYTPTHGDAPDVEGPHLRRAAAQGAGAHAARNVPVPDTCGRSRVRSSSTSGFCTALAAPRTPER
jgi:hypothetical protein